MNFLDVKSNWKEVSDKIKKKYTSLTDEDLLYETGKEEELLERLQKKLGKTKEDIKNLIKRF